MILLYSKENANWNKWLLKSTHSLLAHPRTLPTYFEYTPTDLCIHEQSLLENSIQSRCTYSLTLSHNTAQVVGLHLPTSMEYCREIFWTFEYWCKNNYAVNFFFFFCINIQTFKYTLATLLTRKPSVSFSLCAIRIRIISIYGRLERWYISWHRMSVIETMVSLSKILSPSPRFSV